MDERCLGLLSYTGERGLCPDPIPACNRAWRAKAPCDAHRWLVNLLLSSLGVIIFVVTLWSVWILCGHSRKQAGRKKSTSF
jgi:hypothetical protein